MGLTEIKYMSWVNDMDLPLGWVCSLDPGMDQSNFLDAVLSCHRLFGQEITGDSLGARRNLLEGHYDQCTEFHDDRQGQTSADRCLAMAGCGYDHGTDHCWDECREGHDARPGSTSHARCRALPGCAYDEQRDHCWATESYTVIEHEHCADDSWWYDSDGPYYNCAWYSQHKEYCEWYGHGYENFGHTANTACCACKSHFDRRNLEELDGVDLLPKRGFNPTGEVFDGLTTSYSRFGDHKVVLPTILEGVTVARSQCERKAWWNSESFLTRILTCGEGQVVGDFFSNGLDKNGNTAYSLETGFCCDMPDSEGGTVQKKLPLGRERKCVWKDVTKHGGDVRCDKGFALNGLMLDSEGIKLTDIRRLKCCSTN